MATGRGDLATTVTTRPGPALGCGAAASRATGQAAAARLAVAGPGKVTLAGPAIATSQRLGAGSSRPAATPERPAPSSTTRTLAKAISSVASAASAGNSAAMYASTSRLGQAATEQTTTATPTGSANSFASGAVPARTLVPRRVASASSAFADLRGPSSSQAVRAEAAGAPYGTRQVVAAGSTRAAAITTGSVVASQGTSARAKGARATPGTGAAGTAALAGCETVS